MSFELNIPGMGVVKLGREELKELEESIKNILAKEELRDKIKSGDLTEVAGLIHVAERKMNQTNNPKEKEKYEADIAELEDMLRESPIIQDSAKVKEYLEHLQQVSSLVDYYSYPEGRTDVKVLMRFLSDEDLLEYTKYTDYAETAKRLLSQREDNERE